MTQKMVKKFRIRSGKGYLIWCPPLKIGACFLTGVIRAAWVELSKTETQLV